MARVKLQNRIKNFVAFTYGLDESLKQFDESKRERYKEQFARMLDHEANCISRSTGPLPQDRLGVLLSFRLSLPSWTKFLQTRLLQLVKLKKYDLIPQELNKFMNDDSGVYDEKLAWQRQVERKLWVEGVTPVDMVEQWK